MLFPPPHRRFLARVRVAVFAEVRAGVVLADVLACGQHQRVETPHHTPFPQVIHQLLERVDPLLQWRHSLFQTLLLVVIHRVLHIAMDAPRPQLVEVRQERTRILRPKHDEPGVPVGDIALHTVKRICPC